MTFVIFCFLGYIDSVSNRTIKQIFLFYKFLMFDHGDVCLAARYRRYANLTMFIAFSLRRGLGSSPMLGTLNAVIAETATYSYNKEGVRLDGTMFRCSSMGIKVGGGVGTALTGWLLALGGFDGEAAVQTASAISMINFMYLILPLVLTVAMTFIVARLDVEKANKQLTAAQS